MTEFFGCILSFALGCLFIYLSKNEIKKFKQAKEWPCVEGKIVFYYYATTISVITNQPPDEIKYQMPTVSSKHKMLWLKYEYFVDGLKQVNNKYSLGHDNGASGKDVESVKEGCRLNSKVDVFFNPLDPKESVLSTTAKQSFGFLFLGYFLWFLGCISFFFYFKS